MKKHKKIIINIVLLLSIILLELGVATVIKYQSYYCSYKYREYAFLKSADENYAIKIKYNYPFNEWYETGTGIDVYCIDLREKPYNTIRYIGSWDRYFDTDIIPEEHYKMEWTQKGVTMVIQSADDEPPRKYEIEWDRVFG